MSIEKNYWVASELINKKDKTNNEIRNEKDIIVDKFVNVLGLIGLNDFGWYRSEQTRENKGYFIWRGKNKKKVKKKLNTLFDIMECKKGDISIKNMEKVAQILCDLLPWIKDAKKIDVIVDKSRREIEKFVSLLDQMNKLEILDEKFKVWGKTKDIKKLRTLVKEINELSIVAENRTPIDVRNEMKTLDERKTIIYDRVTDFFVEKMNDVYYEDTIFVRKKCCEGTLSDFYDKQYLLIKRWYIKWGCLISNNDELEYAEDFYNVCKNLYNYKKHQTNGNVDMHEIEVDIEEFFINGSFANDVLERAYKKLISVGIQSFSDYFEKYICNEIMIKMIKDNSIKEVLSVEVIKDESDCKYFAKILVENMRKYIERKYDKKKAKQIKIIAFRELETLRKKMLNYERMGEKLQKEYKNFSTYDEREAFIKWYDNANVRIPPIDIACLEIVFDLKHNESLSIMDLAANREYKFSELNCTDSEKN